jgi:hypothetical protein
VNVVIDEHLPPALARALDALFSGTDQVIHLRTRFGPGVKDVTWISTLSREGRWVVISADRRITRSKAEYTAFRNSRLIGFFLAPGLYKAPLTKQAERILALWGGMRSLAETVEGGAMFELPMKSTRIKQLKP